MPATTYIIIHYEFAVQLTFLLHVFSVEQVLIHRLGTEDADIKIFEYHKPDRSLEISKTKDGKFILLNSNSKTDSEVSLCCSCMLLMLAYVLSQSELLMRIDLCPDQVLVLDASQPCHPPRLVQACCPGLTYFVEHHSGQLLLLVHAAGAADYELYQTPVNLTQRR